MECETVRTNPGVFNAVLTIVEDLAGELLICVVARLLANTIEARLLQQLRQSVRFLTFLICLRLLQLRLSLWTLRLRHLQPAAPVNRRVIVQTFVASPTVHETRLALRRSALRLALQLALQLAL